jgi:Undecaprenyl-phosphate glucose phosphotransferase
MSEISQIAPSLTAQTSSLSISNSPHASLVRSVLARCSTDADATIRGVSRRNTGAGAALLPASRNRFLTPVVVTGLARLMEFVIAIATGLVVALAYLGPAEVFVSGRYILAVTLVGSIFLVAAQASGSYSIAALRSCGRQIPRVLSAWMLAFASLVTMLFLVKAGVEFSRVWLTVWFCGGAIAVVGYRCVVAVVTKAAARSGLLDRRAVIYGAGPATEQLVRELQRDGDCDIDIIGIFDDRGDARVGSSILGHPRLGGAEALVEFCRNTPVDLLIVALPIMAEQRLLDILRKLWVLPVDIRLAAHANKLRFRPRAYSHVGTVPLLDVFDRPIADWDHVTKSIFDKVVAALALIALSPVLALVALAVRLDSKGPVLFRQKRYGFNNELIEVFKFRSMYVNQADTNASKLVTRGDPRVTRVGRFIRKTSLDELPQLFNVLKGELSLVGPRPHALQAKAADRLYQDVVDGYYARHKVKPGITGWAQVNGWRGETDTPEKIQKRVEYDLHYIENWSLFLDISILLRTPLALLKAENAY